MCLMLSTIYTANPKSPNSNAIVRMHIQCVRAFILLYLHVWRSTCLRHTIIINDTALNLARKRTKNRAIDGGDVESDVEHLGQTSSKQSRSLFHSTFHLLGGSSLSEWHLMFPFRCGSEPYILQYNKQYGNERKLPTSQCLPGKTQNSWQIVGNSMFILIQTVQWVLTKPQTEAHITCSACQTSMFNKETNRYIHQQCCTSHFIKFLSGWLAPIHIVIRMMILNLHRKFNIKKQPNNIFIVVWDQCPSPPNSSKHPPGSQQS